MRALPPAVLLGGGVTTLSVGRALGQAGVEVDVLEDGYTDCLARRSRYTRRYVNFPPEGAGDVKPRWLEWLVGAEPAVVLPCGDEGLELVARHRGELAAAGHRCIEAADDVLLTALDKPASYRLATALGVGAPRTIAVHAGEDAAVALDQGLSFPCAVKPTRSDAMLRSHPGHEAPKGAVVRDRAELDAMVRAIVSAGVVALVTELIPGGDERYCSYYTYLDEHGEPLLHFTKRKTRQYPIAFGTGTFHITQWQPDLAAVGQALFQGMGLRGLASAEFKKDERDGEYKLIECTPRFTMSNELVRRSGIDLALVAYNRLVGLPLPPVATFRDNLRLWFPRDDMRALRAYRRAGLLSTTQWLRTLARPPHLPTFSWRDPLPSLAGAKTRWRAALARSPNPTPGERSAHGARGGPAEVAEPSSRS